MSSSIQSLQDQLTNLQAISSQNTAISNAPPTAFTGGIQPTTPDIENVVKNLIGNDLLELKDAILAIQTYINVNVVPPVVVKELTILEAIGLALTGEEQLWLSQPASLKQVSLFLATNEGKDITKLFFGTFKDFYENQTHT